MHDPIVMEARAKLTLAQSRIERASSVHWPVVTATGSKLLPQGHRCSYDYNTGDILPGIRGEMNIFASEAIEADVHRSKSEAEYYHYEMEETKEETVRSFVSLYLNTLREKQPIAVLEQGLLRHNAILNDLSTIGIHDTGRESELVQAEARRLMVWQQVNSGGRVLKTTLGKLSTWTRSPVTEADLENPFSRMTEAKLLTDFTQAPQKDNPSWLASQADVEGEKAALKTQELTRCPRMDLTRSVTRDDQQIGINLSWDLFNRNVSYSVTEEAAQIMAATGRLNSVARMIDKIGRLSPITVRQSRGEMETLGRQEQASARAVDFYRLQFQVVRKTLIELLNAENELYNVGLSRVQTEDQMLHGMLDYLYSQGILLKWSGVNLSGEEEE